VELNDHHELAGGHHVEMLTVEIEVHSRNAPQNVQKEDESADGYEFHQPKTPQAEL
jgi:hypothetical protein